MREEGDTLQEIVGRLRGDAIHCWPKEGSTVAVGLVEARGWFAEYLRFRADTTGRVGRRTLRAFQQCLEEGGTDRDRLEAFLYYLAAEAESSDWLLDALAGRLDEEDASAGDGPQHT